MIALIIGVSAELKRFLGNDGPLPGWEPVQYASPIKAMDSLDELAPGLVLFNASDYPRHWKPFLTFLRQNRARTETVFILMKGPRFPVEEAVKALALGANGIVEAELTDETAARIRGITERYLEPAPSLPGRPILRPSPEGARLGLVFAHPETGRLVTGTVRALSPVGILFEPDDASRKDPFTQGLRITGASLRLGDTILELDLKLLSIGDVLKLSITTASDVGGKTITQYIISQSGGRRPEC